METLLDTKSIGENIRLSRKASGMKAAEVARKLGISESAYTHYERGTRAPTIDFMRKIATVINANPLLLLTVPAKHLINSKADKLPHTISLYSDARPTANEEPHKAMPEVMEKAAVICEKILEKLK